MIFQWVNPEFERQYRVPLEALVGRVVFDALEGSRPQIERHLQSVLETGHPFAATGFLLEYVVDGEMRRTLWDITIDPQRDGAGREPIAAPRNRDHGGGGFRIVSERLADLADRHRQVRFLDDLAGPHFAQQLVLADDVRPVLNEDVEKVERLG